MSINKPYRGPDELPDSIPVFPLEGALLLPRGEMPLSVFEPRYLQMVDDALRTHRLIGMVQPEAEEQEGFRPPLYRCGCAGRITAFGETGDGRYILTLTGVARYLIVDELVADTPYRQCRVTFSPFTADFEEGEGEAEVDRAAVLKTLRDFAEANALKVDWRGIESGVERRLGQRSIHDEPLRAA